MKFPTDFGIGVIMGDKKISTHLLRWSNQREKIDTIAIRFQVEDLLPMALNEVRPPWRTRRKGQGKAW